MLNQLVLVGRLTKDPEIKELESGKKVANITIAVQRPYKNSDGVYESDFIDCSLWDDKVQIVSNYIKGDGVAIKGRLQTYSYEKENGEKAYKLNVIADSISCLYATNQSRKNQDQER